MEFGEVPVEDAIGGILAHSIATPDKRWPKGTVLSKADASALTAAGIANVTIARLEQGDVGEDAAATRIARLLTGDGLYATQATTGRVNLHADYDGVLRLDKTMIDALNRIDEAVTVGTLADFSFVRRHQMAATVKIIPFAVAGTAIATAEAMVQEPAKMRIAPFSRRRASLIQTTSPGTKPGVLDKTKDVTAARLDRLGMRLLSEARCAHEVAALTRAIASAMDEIPEALLITGASAITDRRDVLPAAIEAAGGRLIHFGMPVDPGNLMLIAEIGETPVIGMPGCARSPKLNGLDWVLERLAAKLDLTPEAVMGLGVGGLLIDAAERPGARQPDRHANATEPHIAAVILAAGQSRRFGAENKLLAHVGGVPMVRRSAQNVLSAGFKTVVAVTGHGADEVKEALHGLPVTYTHNPDYAEGLSTSIKAGLRALRRDWDAVAIVLGDMPLIAPDSLKTLCAGYNPASDALIAYPTVNGKRGNPMIFDRRFLPELMALSGDVGARHLLSTHADLARAVAIEDEGPLRDFDSPDALASLQSNGQQASNATAISSSGSDD